MIDEIKECVNCGRLFNPNTKKQICCGKICAKERARKLEAERRLKLNMEKAKKNQLMDIAEAARLEGMSYGKYVAKYGL